MNLKCRLGGHDWRVIHGEGDPTPEEERQDPLLLWWHNSACQRCHEKRRHAVRRRKEQYVPPEGVPAVLRSEYSIECNGATVPIRTEVPSWPPDDKPAEYLKTCVRPGTREMGVMRDGSHPPRRACSHQYKDHGGVRYYGDGRYGFSSGPCQHCSCEGFLG